MMDTMQPQDTLSYRTAIYHREKFWQAFRIKRSRIDGWDRLREPERVERTLKRWLVRALERRGYVPVDQDFTVRMTDLHMERPSVAGIIGVYRDVRPEHVETLKTIPLTYRNVEIPIDVDMTMV
jgi:hypothetical protein